MPMTLSDVIWWYSIAVVTGFVVGVALLAMRGDLPR